MNNKQLQHYFLLGLIGGVGVLAFFIFRPFIPVVVLALVCASIFYPLHQKITRFLRNTGGWAALVTTTIIIIIILIPLFFLGFNIFKESQQFYFFLVDGSGKDIFL